MELAKLIALLQKHPEAKILVPVVSDGQVTEVAATSAYFFEDLDGNAVIRFN